MSDRFHAFEGVRNFRDFGGYVARDGARVKRGRLFRSAHFADASAADIEKLDALHCAFVVDLRRPSERSWQPNKWPGGAHIVTHASNTGNEAKEPPHIAFMRSGELTVEGVDTFMTGIYREMPFAEEHVQLFRLFFAGLVEGRGAGVVHCAAGKDRTGLLSALTLLTLGVPEADVFADYDLTNQVAEFEARLPPLQKALEAHIGRSLPLEALRPFAGVREAWLAAALGAITGRYGSLEGYLEQALGVGPQERARLAQNLLE